MILFKKTKQILLSSAIIFATIHPAFSQEVKASDFTKAEASAARLLSSYLYLNVDWENSSQKLADRFDQLDPDGDGYKKSEADFKSMIRNSGRRVNIITKWLRLDIDGDGSVSENELVQLSKSNLSASRSIAGLRSVTIKPTKEQSALILKKIKASADLPDLDKDGVITFAEMLQAANDKTAKNKTVKRFSQAIDFSFDTDENGIVTKAEYLKVLRDTFVRFDVNKNNILDTKERNNLRDLSLSFR